MSQRKLPPSQQWIGWPVDAPPGEPVVYCTGDADDHLRVTVLLARALRDRADREAADKCLDPRSSWRSRRDALSEVLRTATPAQDGARIGILVDPDALPLPRGGPSGWDDAGFVRERSELLDVMLHAIEAGGWLVVRPSATPALSERLESVRTSNDPPVAGETAEVEPILRPLADALLQGGQLHPIGLARLLRREDPGAALVSLALESISGENRRAAQRIAAARLPMRANGTLGPLEWGALSDGPKSVPRAETESLVERGWLVRDARTSTIWIPRAVRAGLLEGADEASIVATHRALTDTNATDVEQRLEVHHHAILTGNVDAAEATADHYANDLREVARRWSAESRWADAVAVYEKIVQLDEADAYAWEYLGYNLARMDSPAEHPRVEDAYRRAHEIEPSNPLFHGRWLGFRIGRGAATLAEVPRWMAWYATLHGQAGRSWFGWQIVSALRRAGRGTEARSLREEWRIEAPARSERKLPRRAGTSPGIVMAPDFDAPLPEFAEYT